VSLGLPGDLGVDWVLQLADGLATECAVVGAEIAGGDITASEAIVIAISAVGHADRAVRRDTAAPGDVIAYAGDLGMAGAGFATLSRGFRSPRAVVDAHRVPTPPYKAGPQAAAAGATSLIDVSDGLLADLSHIARGSGVVIDLESSAFPISEWVATVADALGSEPLRYVLTGGDDYALVGSFSGEIPEGWTRIGMARDPGPGEEPSVLVDGAPYEGAQGHQHFR
jgi:thiamine-monophosphate kinase